MAMTTTTTTTTHRRKKRDEDIGMELQLAVVNEQTSLAASDDDSFSLPENDDDDDHHDAGILRILTTRSSSSSLASCYSNFLLFSICFSANHSAGLACMALATAQLAATGAWQTGILYFCYTASAVLGATYIVQTFNSQRAMVIGMYLFCVYVACFVGAAILQPQSEEDPTELQPEPSTFATSLAWIGAAIGGTGAGICWTGQGVYYSQASHEYALYLQQRQQQQMQQLANDENNNYETTSSSSSHNNNTIINNLIIYHQEDATTQLAAVFACTILLLETLLDVLSTIGVRVFHIHWSVIFTLYSIVAIASTVVLQFKVKTYDNNTTTTTTSSTITNTVTNHKNNLQPQQDTAEKSWSSICLQVSAAWTVLVTDSKLKYFIPFHAAFGFAGAFLNSYISGEIVPVATGDTSYVGLLVAFHGLVAAMVAVLWSRMTKRMQTKGPVFIVGSIAFAAVGWMALIYPDARTWTWTLLWMVYALEGVGRATFEGTLKAIFADYFTDQKEGAFANIILQYGMASSIGYGLSFRLSCTSTSITTNNSKNTADPYCIEYRDGSYHNVGKFAMLVVVSGLLAVLGYWRASVLHQREKAIQDQASKMMLRSQNANFTLSSEKKKKVQRKTYSALDITISSSEDEPHSSSSNSGLPRIS